MRGDYPDEQVSKRRRSVTEDVLAVVERNKSLGNTQREVSSTLGLGHGSASGALTRLHRADRLARLAQKRNGQYVYVTPQWVGGRPLSNYTPHKGTGTNIVVTREDVETAAWATRYASTRADAASALAQWLGQHGVIVEGVETERAVP